MSQKTPIRFFDDWEVRAVWDDDHAQWWFSVLDIIGVLRGVDDYEENRNYWKYLKFRTVLRTRKTHHKNGKPPTKRR